MKAIILVGGFGTRLKSVVPHLPKPMAPIQDKPFLAYLLDYLKSQGITAIIFSVHHQREKIQDYFQSQYNGLDIQYVIEDKPLGTGGAIAHTLAETKLNEPVFVLNGDTFVKLDYHKMYMQHIATRASFTMALRSVVDTQRYGRVLVTNNTVTEFREKGEIGPGLINAGVYLLEPNVFAHYSLPAQFSIEQDFLVPHTAMLNLHAFTYDDYFIDIGIPEDYARAMTELPALTTQLPKISVIMPVLNRADTIEKAIRSVIDQRYPNVEFIILDAESTDGTLDIIRKYESHLTYWHSEKDRGAADATNFGIKKAAGDLIILLMADDWFEPDTFNRVAQALLAHPDADMVTCGGKIVTADGKTLFSYNDAHTLRLTLPNMMFSATPAICCRFIRKSLYEKIGLYLPFDEHGKQILSNDREFLLRTVMHRGKNIFIKHVGHIYLAHKESFSFGNNRKSVLRHCHEHMLHAENYLQRADLTLLERMAFLYWYGDQSARLFIFNLLESDFVGAWRVAKDSIRKQPLLWPLTFCLATLGIISKKSIRRLRRVFAGAHR